MYVITARNVHQALPLGLRYLQQQGIKRESRNGPVLQSPSPVSTVYLHPNERVLFWPERDANPFFHLYESFWMLAGRNDLAGPVKYAKNMANFSDDGETFHGAYGYRWRHMGADTEMLFTGYDQLPIIVETLKKNHDDRRCVLQMWDTEEDLGHAGKDFPCNLTATLQIDTKGSLCLVVFCRSNDIVWGAYGANAVHFSFLLEYLALAIGVPVGTYTQVSINWHGYLTTLKPLDNLVYVFDQAGYIENPYFNGQARAIPMGPSFEAVNASIARILDHADGDRLRTGIRPDVITYNWAYNLWRVLEAHEAYRDKKEDLSHFVEAGKILAQASPNCDWVVAAKEWLVRRLLKANQKELVHEAMTAGRFGSIL